MKTENIENSKQDKELLEKIAPHYGLKQFDVNVAWKNVHSRIFQLQNKTVQLKKHRKEVFKKVYKYAAVLVVALLLGSIAYYFGALNHHAKIYTEIVSTPNQVIREYVLPDGSKVALNSRSKLTFPKNFKGDIREISIEGEAFFDVARNPEKPFVINAGNAQVKVLGTSFNVCAYPDNKKVEVIVKTGKVQFSNKENKTSKKQTTVLIPGEKGTLLAEKRTLKKSVNADPNYLSWKTHELVFNKIPLKEVIRCLEKTYHIKIELSNPTLENLLYEGHFSHKPIEFVLDVIRLTYNLKLTGSDKHFVLSMRKTT